MLGSILVIYGRVFTGEGVRKKKYDGEWEGFQWVLQSAESSSPVTAGDSTKFWV